jgi:serine/threonine-protein kinase
MSALDRHVDPRPHARYVVERVLGTQPAGRFLAAVDTLAGGRVTLFLPDLAGSGWTADRFLTQVAPELQRGRPLLETGYCTLRDAGLLADGQPFVAVGRPQGVSVAAMLQTGERIGTDRALAIALQVCDLVRRAHGAGIFPAVATPEAIIVDAQATGRMRVSVVDLGLHRDAYGAAIAPVPRPEHFESPQRRRGHPVDQRDDVYAVTALLHAMLYGVAPPPMASHGPADGSGWAVLPNDGQGLDRRLEACLHTVLLRGLARERDDRLPDVAALQRALTGLRQLMGISAPAFELLAATRSRMGRGTDPLDMPVFNPALDRAMEARARVRRVIAQAAEGGANLASLASATSRRQDSGGDIVDIRQARRDDDQAELATEDTGSRPARGVSRSSTGSLAWSAPRSPRRSDLRR